MISLKNSLNCPPYNTYEVALEKLVLDQHLFSPLIDIFLYSRHLPDSYCIILVGRNSALVTLGS